MDAMVREAEAELRAARESTGAGASSSNGASSDVTLGGRSPRSAPASPHSLSSDR